MKICIQCGAEMQYEGVYEGVYRCPVCKLYIDTNGIDLFADEGEPDLDLYLYRLTDASKTITVPQGCLLVLKDVPV